MTNSPRRPAARQGTQSIASLAHLRQPSQIRRRGLADRKHAVAAADNVQQTRWTMQHAADRMHHTARSRRHAQLAAATPTPHAQPASCQSAWCAANHSSCAYAQRRGGPGRALGLTPATTCTAVRASRRRSSCQAASRGADVGRVAAQMWAESRRRCGPSRGADVRGEGRDMQQCDSHSGARYLAARCAGHARRPPARRARLAWRAPVTRGTGCTR